MKDNAEEVLVLSHKLLGELQSTLLKKVISAGKSVSGLLFENAASEIGESASGRKKIKHLQNMLELKQFKHSC